jgi:hypothetical protein
MEIWFALLGAFAAGVLCGLLIGPANWRLGEAYAEGFLAGYAEGKRDHNPAPNPPDLLGEE